jgi:hypothetical protein
MSLEKWSYVAALLGAGISLVGFPVLAAQLFSAHRQRKDAIRLSTTQVMLAADAVLSGYREISVNLRPRGKWFGENAKVHPDNDELPLVEPYLGVFERIFIAVDYGEVPVRIVRDFCGYRVQNIWANDRIVKALLQDEALRSDWKHLIALTFVLEKAGMKFPRHTDTYFPADVFENPKSAKRQYGTQCQ